MNKISIKDRAEFVGQIIDIFEDFLEEKGIDIQNDEKTESDDPAILYGTDYGNLQSALEEMLLNWEILEPYPQEISPEETAGKKKFVIRYIDGHDLVFKSFETMAGSKEEAIELLKAYYADFGDFDHAIISVEGEEE